MQKPGDWICVACGDHQFARNTVCRRCGSPKPGDQNGEAAAFGGATYAPPAGGGGGGGKGGDNVRPGDWSCPSCGDLQFARNAQCRRCGTPKPLAGMMTYQPVQQQQAYQPQMQQQAMVPGAVAPGSMRPGDWICPACGDHQFAKNDMCRRCATPKPGGYTQGYAQPVAQMQMAQPTAAMPANARPGDWICASCGDLQFAKNAFCRRCGSPPGGSAPAIISYSSGATPFCGGGGGGGGGGGAADNMRPGDWTCPNCGDHVFARNSACRRCQTPRPLGGHGGGHANVPAAMMHQPVSKSPLVIQSSHQSKQGDWYCPKCSDLQFARNNVCRKCGEPKPDTSGAGPGAVSPFQGGGYSSVVGGQSMKPGDWICPNCKDLQFARNPQCRKCGTPKPNADDMGDMGRARSRSPMR